MNYKVKREDGKFLVYETMTEQAVMIFKDEKDAKDFAKKWNKGSGFAGWTPSFFIKNIFQSRLKTA